MLKLSYAPIVGSSIPLVLNFKDSFGKMYVPAKIDYTFLALNNDKNTWKIVDDIYKKQVPVSSVVCITIPAASNKTVEGTLLKRQVRVNWSAYLNSQVLDFEEIVEFEVNPTPIITNEKPLPEPDLKLLSPKVEKILVQDDEEVWHRKLRLLFDFPVNASKFEEDTFKIDDEEVTPQVSPSCRILEFDVSTLELGNHTLTVGQLESLLYGVLEPFEEAFNLFQIETSSINLSTPSQESISGQALTAQQGFAELVAKINEIVGEVETLSNTSSSSSSDISQIKNALEDLEKSLGELSQTVSSHYNDLTSMDEEVDKIRSDLNSVMENLGEIDVKALDADIKTLSATVEGLESTVGGHTESIDSIIGRLEKLEQDRITNP